MRVLSRSAITISYKKPFVEWHNRLFPDMLLYENILGESKTYLIDELFDDVEAAVKKHFKRIFEEELFGNCTDENEWPQKRTFKLFCEWFSYEVSDWVVDLSKKSMKSR